MNDDNNTIEMNTKNSNEEGVEVINELLDQIEEKSFEDEVDDMIEANFSFEGETEIEESEAIEVAEAAEETIELPELPDFEEMDEVNSVEEVAEFKMPETDEIEEVLAAEVSAQETSQEIENPEQLEASDEQAQEILMAAEENKEDFDLELDFLDEKKQVEKEWKESTGLDEISICAAIETIIFMSDRPVAIAKIKNTIDKDMPLRPIYDAISSIQTSYEEKQHGIRLVEVAEGYQFRTKLNYASYVETINKSTSFTLSPTALEVLAIIAYRQPISRTEIDRMRGVDSSHIVRALMDKRLVSIAGRSDELGRPTTYKSTPEFLEFFNLNTIDDLPPESELFEMTKSNIGKISDIKEICKFDAKEKFVFDDIDELDELTDTIKQISADTDFTKSLKGKKEDGEKASPFDLMEQFLEKETLVNFNKDAIESAFMGAVNINMVDIISASLSEGPFNEPEAEDDEDSFLLSDEEMEELEETLESETLEFDKEDIEKLDEVVEEVIDKELGSFDGELYAEAPQEEREELIAQFQDLQEAEVELEKEDLEEDESLQSFEDNVEEVQNMAAELAEELDLDLSFMKSETSEPAVSNDEPIDSDPNME